MLWKKKKDKSEEVLKEEVFFDEEDMDDDEFFMAEEIDGYTSCAGVNAQRCSSECFKAVMMPTVTILS